MTSSKTTVLGIRLDHERRAWVEAEAARHGVSVRALFEYMIDEARYEEALDKAAQQTQETQEPEPLSTASGLARDTVTPDVGAPWSSVREHAEVLDASPRIPSAPPTLCDELVSVAGIPVRLVRRALSVPGSMIKAASRCIPGTGRA